MSNFPRIRTLASTFFFMLAISGLVVLSSLSAFGQATTGNLKGTVTDQNGAVVSGATVTAKNQQTGVESSFTTTGEGFYNITALLPGKYTVTVEGSGFSRSAVTDVDVRVGVDTPLDVAMKPGSVTETVTVTAGSEEIVQREQSQISASFEARKVSELPSNGAGGGIDTLALLSPGVIANRVGGTNTNGAGLSVNGNRGRSNNFQIDGADNNDLSVGGPALFVDFQDSVQEYQIITSNFSAQYGRNQGAVVNIVGKSGGNDFHGTAFLFHQDAAVLNSLNNIDRASGQERNPASLLNVYGGTFGGRFPLPRFGEGGRSLISGKDRFFFFGGYQGIRNPASSLGRSTSLGILDTEFARLQATFPGNAVVNTIATFSPWAITRGGLPRLNSASLGTTISTKFNLSAPTGCPRAIAVTATPAAGCGSYTTFINPTTGLPFLTGGPYDTLNWGTAASPLLFQAAQYERTVPVGYTEDYFTLRFDLRVTDKDSINLRYINQKSASQNALVGPAGGFNGDLPAGSKHYGAGWTRTFSNSVVNEFRVSYQRIGVEFGGGCDPSTPGCIPGPGQIDVALANISFAPSLGITKTNAMPTIGPATNLPQGRVGKVYQYANNLNWTVGGHSLILGAEHKYLDTIVPFLPNFNGSFAYNSLQRIQNNAPSAVSITLGDPLLPFIEKDWYFFVQDDFKVRPNLTLNLGMRYEYTGQPINILHDVSVARESNAATAFYNTSLPVSARTVPEVPVDKNNFAPRLGFAYSPKFWKGLFGEDATVFRGGFSIAYDPAFYNILLNVQTGAPFSIAITVPVSSLPATGSPAPLPNSPFGNVVRAAATGFLVKGVLNPIFLAQTTVAPDFHAPFSRQFSFGMQRQMGRNHVAEVRYVGTQGRDLFQNINGNFFIGPLVNGFTRSVTTDLNHDGTPESTSVVFPSFASILPSGTVSQVCTDVGGTPDNEGACNQRQFRQGGVTERRNSASSDYHSMQARYNGRFFKNAMSLGLAYTWSKTMDNASEIFAFADIASPNAQDPFCLDKCERALSNLDRPHAFSANFIYDVPFFKEQRGVAGHLLGGWQINGTYILTSGGAYTAGQTFNGNNIGLGNTYLTAGDRPFIGNRAADERLVGISQIDAAFVFGIPAENLNGFWSLNAIRSTGDLIAVTPNDVRFIFNGPGSAKIFGTPYGDSVRNSLRGPIFNQLNMSLFKNIKIFERLTLQLRGEAFNVLNHPNGGFGVAAPGVTPLPSINVGNAGLEGGAFAEHKDVALANRVVQVGFRVIF